MRVLAFRHVPFEGLGLIGPALRSHGIAFDYVDLYHPHAELPGVDGYDGLIFLGGPMCANDPLPYLKIEMRAMESAIRAGKPVLGVCLGAQLIANMLGAPVYRNQEPEIGWFDIDFTQSAGKDPVFTGLNTAETVFHWHSDTFELPGGAELLARSARTERQAFRYGPAVYGLQFHLEVTPRMIVNWYREDGYCGEACSQIRPWTNRRRLDHVARQVFGRWCKLVTPREK